MDVGASPQQIHSTIQLKVPCCLFSPPSLFSSAQLEVLPWLLLSDPELLCLKPKEHEEGFGRGPEPPVLAGREEHMSLTESG